MTAKIGDLVRPASVIAVLRDARELLTPEANWTRMTIARTADGSPTFSEDDNATCWCLSGAVSRVSSGRKLAGYEARCELMDRIPPYPTGVGILMGEWNDSPNRTHADILALLDRTISELEGLSPAPVEPSGGE